MEIHEDLRSEEPSGRRVEGVGVSGVEKLFLVACRPARGSPLCTPRRPGARVLDGIEHGW